MCLRTLYLTIILLALSIIPSFAADNHCLSDYRQAADSQGRGSVVSGNRRTLPQNREVDASKFRAAAIPDAVMLRWNFEHPDNLKKAVLERSFNGRSFVPVATLSSKSNAFTDSAYTPGCVYRIRMVATNGTVVMSSVINLQGEVPSVATKR